MAIGTVSGSGAANSITVGSATIPAMINAGMPVIEFGAKHKSLEDVFLHVTEGRVQ